MSTIVFNYSQFRALYGLPKNSSYDFNNVLKTISIKDLFFYSSFKTDTKSKVIVPRELY
jgi:hypothetical protein